jgi:uncharacterized membrane protein YraQ (UPF0718 family)
VQSKICASFYVSKIKSVINEEKIKKYLQKNVISGILTYGTFSLFFEDLTPPDLPLIKKYQSKEIRRH